MLYEVYIGVKDVPSDPIRVKRSDVNFTQSTSMPTVSVSSPNTQTWTYTRPVYNATAADRHLVGNTWEFNYLLWSTHAKVQARTNHIFTGLNTAVLQNSIYEYKYYRAPDDTRCAGIVYVNGVANTSIPSTYADLVQDKYCVFRIIINSNMLPKFGFNVEWYNGLTSVDFKYGYINEQQIATGIYLMNTSIAAGDNSIEQLTIVYHNNSSAYYYHTYPYSNFAIDVIVQESWQGFAPLAYIDKEDGLLDDRVEYIENSIGPLTEKVGTLRSQYVTR